MTALADLSAVTRARYGAADIIEMHYGGAKVWERDPFSVEGRIGFRYPLTLGTVFQDVKGTVPVTASDQPLGLILDTSEQLILGPELTPQYTVVSGTLPTGLDPGTYIVRRSADSSQFWVLQFPAAVVGRDHEITFTAADSGLGEPLGISVETALGRITAASAPGTYTVRLPAGVVGPLRFIGDPPGRSALISNISCRQLPGKHRRQPVALNRPAWRLTASGLPYISYNGTNQWMSTQPFSWGSDKVTISAGVRKLSDAAAFGALLEFSTNSTTSNGAFALFAPGDPGSPSYQWHSRGTARVTPTYSDASIAAPVTSVLTALGDISGDRATLRVNGQQRAQATTDQGTGNYGTYQLFFGSRAGTTLRFNGLEFPTQGINVALTGAELAQFENWVAQRTGPL